MPLLLGLDVGTSGTKAVVIDETGRLVAQASAEYPISSPRPLWSEQNPADWRQAVEKCISAFEGITIDAIGLTGQMHGAVFLDSNNEVIRPAILWNDQRTIAECREIEEKVERIREITGNPPLTGFQLPKILWLRNHEPENFKRLAKVLLPKDYIRFLLTGDYATDVSDASGVGALDITTRNWSSEVIDALGLDPSLFPPVFESSQVTGRGGEVPVVAGGGDQAAGAVGTGAVVPGVVSVSLGTSGVVFSALDRPTFDPNGATHTFCHANGAWHAMGVTLSCGGAIRWFRDTLGNGKSYDELSKLANQVEIGASGLVFTPYLSGERCPFNDPTARAAFVGATLAHTSAHFARSAFEGASFALMDAFRAMNIASTEVRVTGGGAKGEFWVQMLADIFQTPCVTLESDEGPAFGAAILAGMGIGVWSTLEEACQATIRTAKRFEPSGCSYELAYKTYGTVSQVTRELSAALVG